MAQDNLARKQIFIPASQPEAVVLRVAAYCRVSTDSEDQLNSFAAQQSYYNDYIRKHVTGSLRKSTQTKASQELPPQSGMTSRECCLTAVKDGSIKSL